jgi:hypothetical protein
MLEALVARIGLLAALRDALVEPRHRVALVDHDPVIQPSERLSIGEIVRRHR